MARNPKYGLVKAKALTRGDIREVGLQYLVRLQPSMHLMHQILRLLREDEGTVKTATRQYVIALASHLETFFRDTFRYCLENYPDFYLQILQAQRFVVPPDQTLVSKEVTCYDVVSEAFPLQSTGSIADAFNPLFQPEGFQFAVENTQFTYSVPARSLQESGFLLSEFPNWWQDLSQIFELRHEVLHDANSVVAASLSDTARFEALAVMLPQYVIMMIEAVSLVVGGLGQTPLPAMLLVEDLLSNDWEEVSEDGVGCFITSPAGVKSG